MIASVLDAPLTVNCSEKKNIREKDASFNFTFPFLFFFKKKVQIQIFFRDCKKECISLPSSVQHSIWKIKYPFKSLGQNVSFKMIYPFIYDECYNNIETS